MPHTAFAPEGSTVGWARRLGLLAAVTAASATFVLGPVSSARADTAVGSISELADAMATQPSGATIVLGADLIGDANSDLVGVAAGRALTLDLNGHRLVMVRDDEDPNGSAGLGVPAGATLTIIDSAPGGTVGRLDATGSYGNSSRGGGAGIGGAAGEAAGTVVIEGGDVTAQGGFGAAGIGGGGDSGGGIVTINGGTVTATGGEFAAGIGGGLRSGGGTIAINGGAVTAQSSNELGTAIGGGYLGAGASVTIAEGAVVTVGSESVGQVAFGSAGIEPDAGNFGSLSNAGTLILPAFNWIDIPAGVVVTNSGTIRSRGTLTVDGTLANTGVIVNASALENPENVTGHNVTVLLDGNGGAAPANPDVVFAGTFQEGQIDFPGDATRAGFTFVGWFTQTVGGTRVTATTDLGLGGPTSMTLHAQWSKSAGTGGGGVNPPVSDGDGGNPPVTGGDSAHPGVTVPDAGTRRDPADGGAPRSLAATGADALPAAYGGFALILAGLGLLLRRRRITH